MDILRHLAILIALTALLSQGANANHQHELTMPKATPKLKQYRTIVNVTDSEKEFFWSNVKKSEGCWEWIGKSDRLGYGKMHLTEVTGIRWGILATRISLFIQHGQIDPKLMVRHKCDNPRCVNPDHLLLGTYADNYRDMVERGRRRVNLGTGNGNSRLQPEDIPAIRLLLEQKKSRLAIGRQFGVSGVTIGMIEKGITWKHIT